MSTDPGGGMDVNIGRAKERQQRIVDPVLSDQAGRQMPVDPLGTNAPVEVKIRLRAYEIYEQRGRTDGQALEHWLQAEREVK